MSGLPTHCAEVVLLAALAFFQLQFAVWSQEALMGLGGGWVGAVGASWICAHCRPGVPLVCQFLFLLSLPVQVVVLLGD